VALICDTGPLYAAMDQEDPDHGRCAQLLSESIEPLLVPAPVLVELDWLAGTRLGPHTFDAVLSDIEDGVVHVVDLVRADYVRARQLCTMYADLPLGFVDAAVLSITERLGEFKLATLDQRHFRVVRPRHTASLTLLPELP
jgi:predicted nucleic acid-binding protein